MKLREILDDYPKLYEFDQHYNTIREKPEKCNGCQHWKKCDNNIETCTSITCEPVYEVQS